MAPVEGRAPGRLDLLGGVADYAGALVLETPTRVVTTVTAEAADALVVGPVVLRPYELAGLAHRPYDEIRAALADHPRWTHYVVGVALVLVRHGVIEPPAVELTVGSDVPVSVGVSSSAALEVATARALGAGGTDGLRLAALCQEAENQVVGAPCGIMDQVTAALGAPGALVPILCRPASVDPLVALPPGAEVVGWPTGALHDVSGIPYRRARTAAFMGKRIVEDGAGRTWDWISELPSALVADLPEVLEGAAFLDRWAGTDDHLTVVDPTGAYPVRAAAAFGGDEHRRVQQAVAVLSGRGDLTGLSPLLAASHAGYDAVGLGHPAATAVVEEALARPGVVGARSSGGGAGGTVVVVCERGALDDVDGLIR
jgi:L-arabinokinase